LWSRRMEWRSQQALEPGGGRRWTRLTLRPAGCQLGTQRADNQQQRLPARQNGVAGGKIQGRAHRDHNGASVSSPATLPTKERCRPGKRRNQKRTRPPIPFVKDLRLGQRGVSVCPVRSLRHRPEVCFRPRDRLFCPCWKHLRIHHHPRERTAQVSRGDRTFPVLSSRHGVSS